MDPLIDDVASALDRVHRFSLAHVQGLGQQLRSLFGLPDDLHGHRNRFILDQHARAVCRSEG